MATHTSVNGFSSAATQFFEDLEDQNTREFWLAHRDVFEREILHLRERLRTRKRHHVTIDNVEIEPRIVAAEAILGAQQIIHAASALVHVRRIA